MPQKKKHILILSSWYPTPENPFLGNFVQRQAELIAKLFQVTVLYTYASDTQRTISFNNSELNGVKQIIVNHPKGTHFLSRSSQRKKAFDEGLKLIENPDIIHAHVLLPNGFLFLRAQKLFKCPFILTDHGSYYRSKNHGAWSLKGKITLQIVKRSLDRIVAVSDFLKKDMQPFFPGMEIKVIPNPINIHLFYPSKEKQNQNGNFLHVSTLDKQTKNTKGIIEAIALLVKKGYEEVRLKIISDEQFNDWQLEVNKLGLSEYITFEGPLKPTELAEVYRKASCFVLFSHYESFSIVIAEAWASGIPVISTPVGIAENMSSELGYLVKDNDSLSLAMAMEKILNDGQFDSSKIREHALSYSDENVLKMLTELYSEFHG